MNEVFRTGGRIAAALIVRDAALALLEKAGKPSGDERGRIWFQQHTLENPTPHLSLSLSRHPLDGRFMLNVWCMLRGKYVKALNIEWNDEAVGIVTFRRGEWESELLAMGRAKAVH